MKLEEDGELHIQLELDPAYETLLNPVNDAKQKGRLVLELTPRDAGHIPHPQLGWRVTVTGVWLTDGKPPSHGWNEIHPIFQARPRGPDVCERAAVRRRPRLRAKRQRQGAVQGRDGRCLPGLLTRRSRQEPRTPRGRLDGGRSMVRCVADVSRLQLVCAAWRVSPGTD